jgi:hypothetical protein
VVCARPRVRTLNTANHDGWQRGERLEGRDAVQVAVQQRVAGADNADMSASMAHGTRPWLRLSD